MWCTNHGGHNSLVKPAAAVSALGELTPGGELMKGFIAESQARKFMYLFMIFVFYFCIGLSVIILSRLASSIYRVST